MTDTKASEPAADSRAEAMQDARERIEAARDAVEDGLDEAYLYLKRQWRERPLAVAGAALGAGVLLGLLLNGRR
jgi:ElaB/YqjD/DUF883 family membrane-anchored ribosome-binding protein